MKAIKLPDDYNYIAVFLTMACNLQCSYCINRFEKLNCNNRHLSGEQWVSGLNRIISNNDLPVTLQGGEPSLHPDFLYILNNIKKDINIDILTNLQFDIDKFMKEVPAERIKRKAQYASIRVSYHPENMDPGYLVETILKLKKAGYSVGIWGILHPEYEHEIMQVQEYCRSKGIDFRTKDFLGEYNGKIYGNIKYEGACSRQGGKHVMCNTTELIIGTDGGIYRCHSDLYNGRKSIGNILDPEYEIKNHFRECNFFGHCNPCDVKIKTNRHQISGHTSVEIIMSEKTDDTVGRCVCII